MMKHHFEGTCTQIMANTINQKMMNILEMELTLLSA